MDGVKNQISRAANGFRALRRSVFSDSTFLLTAKCMVCQAVIVGVLLYAVETWPVKQRKKCFRDISPLLLKNTIGYLKSFADFLAYQ